MVGPTSKCPVLPVALWAGWSNSLACMFDLVPLDIGVKKLELFKIVVALMNSLKNDKLQAVSVNGGMGVFLRDLRKGQYLALYYLRFYKIIKFAEYRET